MCVLCALRFNKLLRKKHTHPHKQQQQRSTVIQNKTNIYNVIGKGKIHENENCKIFNKMAFALACMLYTHTNTQLSRRINMRCCCCCCNCDLISMVWLCMQLNLNSFHCERRGTVLLPLRRCCRLFAFQF